MENSNSLKRLPMFTNHALLMLIMPLIIEQFLAVAVGMADTAMVTGVGEAAVSAVSLVDSINTLLIQLFSAMSAGGSIIAAQYVGNRD
jgi:Na+-driven multidrug efflux pump